MSCNNQQSIAHDFTTPFNYSLVCFAASNISLTHYFLQEIPETPSHLRYFFWLEKDVYQGLFVSVFLKRLLRMKNYCDEQDFDESLSFGLQACEIEVLARSAAACSRNQKSIRP